MAKLSRDEYIARRIEDVGRVLDGVVASGTTVEAAHEIREFTEADFDKLYIRPEHGGKPIKLRLNKNQKKILADLNRQIRAKQPSGVRQILLKARQFGGSTFYCAILYFLITMYGYRVVIMAQDLDAANTLFKKIKLFHMKDISAKPEIIRRGTREFGFDNLGEVWVGSAGTGSMRSQNNMALLLTELPQWCRQVPNPVELEEQFTAILNTVADSPYTFIFNESTARGLERFYRDWTTAKKGAGAYTPIFVGWLEIEKYSKAFPTPEARTEFCSTLDADEEMLAKDYGATPEQLYWRRACILNKCGGSAETFKQEYPCNDTEAFLQSGQPYFDQNRIAGWLRGAEKPVFQGECMMYSGAVWAKMAADETHRTVGYVPSSHGRLKIWEWPQEYEDYGMGTDVSEGIIGVQGRADDSAIAIIKRSTRRVVATWRGKIHPEDLADLLVALGISYNQAYSCGEANNHGHTTVSKLWKQYPKNRIYNVKKTEDVGYSERSERLWFYTSGGEHGTKIRLMDTLAVAIRAGDFQIDCKETIKELTTCSKDSKGHVDTQGKDSVIALAMSLMALIHGTDMQRRPQDRTPREIYISDKKERKREGEMIRRQMAIRESA